MRSIIRVNFVFTQIIDIVVADVFIEPFYRYNKKYSYILRSDKNRQHLGIFSNRVISQVLNHIKPLKWSMQL